MLANIKNFINNGQLRYAYAGWLLYAHFLGVCGLLYLLYNYQSFIKVFPFIAIFQHLYGLGITAGAHRLWAHKTYSAKLPLRIFLMLMNSGMFQGSILAWSRDHRVHHKYSDTDLDPHNIKRGFFYAHAGWILQKKSPKMIEAGKNINMQDLVEDPVIQFQRKYYLYLAVFMCIILPTAVYSSVLPIIPAYLTSMFSYIYTLNATWCVNSICHMFGSRPWNPNIEPRDNYFVALVSIGEGYHNWHHEYPSDWRASKNEWYMPNFTTRFIELCCFLGLATVKN